MTPLNSSASPLEAKPKELGFYGGYDTFDGVIFGANYTNRNIDGLGRIFSFHLNYTGRGPDGEISYENPWFLEKNIDFNAALGVSAKDLIGYSIQNYYARRQIYEDVPRKGSKRRFSPSEAGRM